MSDTQMAVYDGKKWVSIKGEQGDPGPHAVSTDPNNAAKLGSDNLIFVDTVLSGGVPDATTTTKGIVRLATSTDVTNSVSGPAVDAALLSALLPSPYVLPKATAALLGGVKIGSGINLAADGTISVAAGVVDWSNVQNKPTFHAVATSGDYRDLDNLPALSAVALTGKYGDLTERPALTAVATSGDYNDLSNTPTLAAVAISGSYSDLVNRPTFATVASTGKYGDLLSLPTRVT